MSDAFSILGYLLIIGCLIGVGVLWWKCVKGRDEEDRW